MVGISPTLLGCWGRPGVPGTALKLARAPPKNPAKLAGPLLSVRITLVQPRAWEIGFVRVRLQIPKHFQTVLPEHPLPKPGHVGIPRASMACRVCPQTFVVASLAWRMRDSDEEFVCTVLSRLQVWKLRLRNSSVLFVRGKCG